MKAGKAQKPVKFSDQIAALPIRWDGKNKLRILMVTSRGTGRWVLPKGWTMDGKKPWHAAEIEALEEAGAIGHIGSKPLGHYHYRKIMPDGSGLPVRVVLFPMLVDKLKSRWKERGDRTRHWFSPKGAANRVDEPELRELLLSLVDKPRQHPLIKKLLKAS